jgi:hypothetical protein
MSDVTTATPQARVSPFDLVARRAYMVLPGLYAWGTTVATPAGAAGASLWVRTSALVALVALLVGPFLIPERARLGRAIGVHGFVGFCLLTWVLLGGALSVQRLDPLRALLGALGWMLFAFGWGSVRELGHVPEEDPHALPGPPLSRRGRLPPLATALFALALLGALAPMLAAWRVARPTHALMAHSVAMLCAILVLSAGARLAVERDTWRAPPPERRFLASMRPLSVLALTLVLGLMVWMLR